MKVRWTEQALSRLSAIQEYVEGDSPAAAIRLVARLIRRTRPLGRNPYMGRTVPDLPETDLRELIEGNYRIVYRVHPPFIQVLTVFEGHRRFPIEDLPEEEG